MESVSQSAAGLCTTNGRADADATSCNIQLNVRTTPSLSCPTLFSFERLLSVMLHEITHITIGLEDIHPPAFYDAMRENRRLYEQLKSEIVSTADGSTIDREILHSDDRVQNANVEVPEEQFVCGAKKRRKPKPSVGVAKAMGLKAEMAGVGQKRKPLLKGAKMVDGRSKKAKESKEAMENMTPRELAAQAAARRFAQNAKTTSVTSSVMSSGAAKAGAEREVICIDDSSEDDDNANSEQGGFEVVDDDDDDEVEEVQSQHDAITCGCRACTWDRELSFFDGA
jgi:hypothetical protein